MKRNIAERAATNIARLWHGITSHPVELLVLLHATVAAMLKGSPWWQMPAYYASFATVAALCLSFHRSNRWVAVAYWIVLPLYALTALLPAEWHGMTEYWLLSALLPAVYMLAHAYSDFNARFFSMVRSSVIAAGIGILAFILLLLIDASVQTLFSLEWYHAEEYIAIFCFVLLTPMLFIGMESSTEKPIASRLEEVLVNWVLTPALLIYNIVLYVYLAMIVIRWDLPKGSVATMVSLFIGVAVAVRWLRPMLQKQPLGWYFRWFGLLALPLVALFWVATGYRIGQYGFTHDRCILVATGVLMTAFAVLSMLKSTRGGYWFLVGYVVVGLLLAVGGPLSARQVSLRSQTKVVRQYAEKIGILNADGTLIKPSHQESDSVYRKEHRAIYQAIKYIQNDLHDTTLCREQFGLTSGDYLEGLSRSTYNYATAWRINPDEDTDDDIVEIASYRVGADRAIDITDIDGYNKMYTNLWFSDGKISFGNTTLDADSVLAVQLAKIGYTLKSNLERDKLNQNSKQLCIYRSPDGRLLMVFEYFHIERHEDGNHMTYGTIDCAMTKN